MLGLPDGITTCLFDLDGVLTQTAKVHARSWKEMFDNFLRGWYARKGEPFREFVLPDDYDTYVDGKPRRDGVQSFLESRGIDLPMGSPQDSPDDETIYGLGFRKNDIVLKMIHDEGVEPYEGSAVFEDALPGVEAWRAGHFGFVVGVDRVDHAPAPGEHWADVVGHAAALSEHGADVVVQDLSELLEDES